MAQRSIDDLLALTKGSYQRGLVLGHEDWSGASLKGKAKEWGGQYRKSRRNLLKRIEKADLGYLLIGRNGKIELMLGRPPASYKRIRVNCGLACVMPPHKPTVLDHMLKAMADG